MPNLQKIKNLYHSGISLLANIRYSFPSRKMYVIGVTGTNGKTTTVALLTRILEEAGFPTASASTIRFKIRKKEWVNKTKFTTLASFDHQNFLARAVRAGCKFAVLETSSHALDQNRAWGTDYDMAVITNVTREHLDYHQSMSEYRLAKQKLFRCVALKKGKKLDKDRGILVVNFDMVEPGEFMLGKSDRIYIYKKQKPESNKGVKQLNRDKDRPQITNSSDNALKAITLLPDHIVEAKNISLGRDGSAFSVRDKEYKLKLEGDFNVENALAAIAAGLSLGISEEDIKKAVESVDQIPGRMEYVPNNKGLSIIIDYALTPDSMEKVGSLIARRAKNKLIWIFGSCGERDRGKRPIMGRIGGRYADTVIITNEDPYHEDPQAIIEEVFAGVLVSKGKVEEKNAFKIPDRKEALRRALALASRGDVILVTGKGAEENMKIEDTLIPWNDKRVIQELLAEL